MGNMESSGSNSRRRHGGGGGSERRIHPPPQPVIPLPDITVNRFVYPAAATPYCNYHGYYPPPYDNHRHRQGVEPMWGQYPPAPFPASLPVPSTVPVTLPVPSTVPEPFPEPETVPAPEPLPEPETVLAPNVGYKNAVIKRNNFHIEKETLRIEPDEENPGRFLVSFMFNATVSASFTIFFFGKEEEGGTLTPMKENVLPPVTVNIQPGLGQKFKQPAGTGIDFSILEESELLNVGDMDVYPVAIKADASSSGNTNSQITQAVFKKEKGEFKLKVVKQILWENGMRYELHDIYGIGNSVESDWDGNDTGKACVICLSEPPDTTVVPCCHMCMCRGCAKVSMFQTTRCPICRQPVVRYLEVGPQPQPEE
ncbi:hypothetical protein Fmac_027646 [Flemingia macrophylla]|uniref:RING-type E3 ubiquitin transferase n=1 Tax=Flemingia macrophylla TaxID=520843 RepID=A0ABD1LIG7_9FABA